MKWSVIGIPDPTQTATDKFETLEHCCEVLTDSIIKGKATYLRAHDTQTREGREAGRDRRVDREEGELRALKATVGKKANWKMKRACEGGGWLTALPISQGGTDLSREEFRDSLLYHLDLLLQDPPLTFNDCSYKFTVEHVCSCKRGGACRSLE